MRFQAKRIADLCFGKVTPLASFGTASAHTLPPSEGVTKSLLCGKSSKTRMLRPKFLSYWSEEHCQGASGGKAAGNCTLLRPRKPFRAIGVPTLVHDIALILGAKPLMIFL